MRVSCNKITTEGGQDVQPQFSMDTQDVPQEQVRESVVSLILEEDHKKTFDT